MLTLPEGDVRSLMNLLLVQTAFDDFELRGCTIQSFARFDIEGIISPADEVNEGEAPRRAVYCKWQRLRPYIYHIIKGSEKPRFLKLVFAYPPEGLSAGFQDAQALFVNITLDKDLVHITTGASMKTWSLDKAVETQWDDYIVDFLIKHKLNINKE